MSDSNHFYNKIIDEEKVAALFKESPKEANRPHKFWFLSLLFSLFTVFIATFHGYRFEDNKVSIAFIVVLALASISLIFGIFYCGTMIGYSILRKKRYPILYVIIQTLLMGICVVMPYWTTKVEKVDGLYHVYLNALPLLLAFLFMMILIFLHYYAVSKGFKKYVKEQLDAKFN